MELAGTARLSIEPGIDRRHISPATPPKRCAIAGAGAASEPNETVRFRLLGSVGFVSGGAMRTVDGARQRTLLALLLINLGEVVSKEQFFGELWGDKVPALPDNALQALVARFRRTMNGVLGDQASAARLVTRPTGYMMDADPDSVDAHLFNQLTARARGLMSGDPVGAQRIFDRALGLWRGPALQGVSGGAICRGAVAQLEENRLAATEDRIRTTIAIAGCSSVISELKRLAFLHPGREQLCELLMVCLYRLGRQSEAVQAYHQLRRHLAEEFGMEPSLSVKRCMMAILNQDPALGSAERLVIPRPPVLSPAIAS